MLTPDSIRIITVFSFFIFFIIGTIKRPIWAVIAYMILVYCKVSSYYPAFGAMKAELVFAILILIRIFFTKNSFSKISPHYNPVIKYLFFFVISVLLSFSIAWDYQYSWDAAIYHFIKVLFLIIMLLIAINDEKDLKIFTWSFIIMFAYLAYEPIYSFLLSIGGSVQMYGINYISDIGILSGHVALANNMNQMIPIAYFLIFSVQKKLPKLLATIPLTVFVIALIGSGSRGGVMGFMIFGACLIYFSKNRLTLGIILGVFFLILIISTTTISSTANRINQGSIIGRLIGLSHGLGILRKGNILGVGPGCYLFARGKYFSYRMESHNLYGQILGDLGIPGTITWFFLIRQIFLNLADSKKKLMALSMENSFLYKLAMGVQVSLIVRLFISLGSHGLYYFYWYVMAVISIALFKQVESLPTIKSHT